MTNAFPINGELGGQSLTWQCPPMLGVAPEALECFQEGVERLQTGDAGAALVALSRCTELEPSFAEAHVFMGLANALSSKIYPAIDHLELAASRLCRGRCSGPELRSRFHRPLTWSPRRALTSPTATASATSICRASSCAPTSGTATRR